MKRMLFFLFFFCSLGASQQQLKYQGLTSDEAVAKALQDSKITPGHENEDQELKMGREHDEQISLDHYKKHDKERRIEEWHQQVEQDEQEQAKRSYNAEYSLRHVKYEQYPHPTRFIYTKEMKENGEDDDVTQIVRNINKMLQAEDPITVLNQHYQWVKSRMASIPFYEAWKRENALVEDKFKDQYYKYLNHEMHEIMFHKMLAMQFLIELAHARGLHVPDEEAIKRMLHDYWQESPWEYLVDLVRRQFPDLQSQYLKRRLEAAITAMAENPTSQDELELHHIIQNTTRELAGISSGGE